MAVQWKYILWQGGRGWLLSTLNLWRVLPAPTQVLT